MLTRETATTTTSETIRCAIVYEVTIEDLPTVEAYLTREDEPLACLLEAACQLANVGNTEGRLWLVTSPTATDDKWWVTELTDEEGLQLVYGPVGYTAEQVDFEV
jgi:hypothetical protein